MKKIATLLTMVTVAMLAAAQMANPVTFTSQLRTTNGSSEGEIVFTGKIDKGWNQMGLNGGSERVGLALYTRHFIIAQLLPNVHPYQVQHGG